MKNIFGLILILLFSSASLLAQKNELLVKSSENGLYLDHKVAPKESYYSLGRLYNLHPKTLAAFNKLDMNKGLNIDQKIRIPLTDTNFTQNGNSGTPVLYRVGENEGLLTVSKKNNNVTLAKLRQWNGLSSDQLKKDAKLIIGFLISKEMKAVTIAGAPVKEEVPVITAEKKEPVVVTATEDITKKEEKKIAEAEEKSEKKEVKKEEKKETIPPVVKDIRKPSIEGQGYFKTHFEQQVKVMPVSKEETVTSGIFKPTSGWEDAKYYLLMDKVQPGTIIKLINPSNNKAVFAKVLGEMAGIRQNQGYNIRISNAAAAALEITEQDKFIIKTQY
ncbi:MAG: LysM peptidoglycan-binding domain-containing protein [Chitinophagaceae bacterium]|nr:LysM peptidoglycan-binding domain-containing protein [Chitinophagaceae bacterium]